MADAELSSILNRRQEINDKLERNEDVRPQFKVKNIYTEFHELTRKDIKNYQDIFNKYVISHLFLSTSYFVSSNVC